MESWDYTGPEGFGRAVQKLAALFYTDDDPLASTRSARLQDSLDVLKGLLYRVVLWTNVEKTVGMIYQPCRRADSHLVEAYRRRMMGGGHTYRERQRDRVWCLDCGVELATGSLTAHFQTQHIHGR